MVSSGANSLFYILCSAALHTLKHYVPALSEGKQEMHSFLWKRNKVGSPQNDLIVSNETATEKVKRNKYMCWGFGELTGFMPKSCMALRGGDIIS